MNPDHFFNAVRAAENAGAGASFQFLGVMLGITVFGAARAEALDWPTLGRDESRNAVSHETNAPIRWEVRGLREKAEWNPGPNVKWLTRLGIPTFSVPVVANGLVWIGTNNENPRDPAVKGDCAVLVCLRESDGEFLWQYVAPRRKGVRSDWQGSGVKCGPTIEGDLMWFKTPGGDLVCLDIGPLHRGAGLPREVWKLDIPKELDVMEHVSPMGWSGSASSVGLYQDWIYLNTGHGVEWDHQTVALPRAPSLVCVEKRTGKVVWEDASPGADIFHGQGATPLAFEIDGVARVACGFGDGKLRCFTAQTGELLWTVDCNPAQYRTRKYPEPQGPSEILAAPMLNRGRIYVVIGQDPENGEGVGNLLCVDAANGRVIWENHAIERSLSTPIRVDEQLYLADFSGFVYCLSAETGKIQWRFDARAPIWGSPLYADGRLYIGDEDGDMMVFYLEAWREVYRKAGKPVQLRSPQPDLVSENNMQAPVYRQALFVNGTLYVTTTDYLCAIESTGHAAADPTPGGRRAKVPDTVFASTTGDVIQQMLELAQVKASDVLYDLGSGDGRIVIAAAKRFGCKALGYEINAELVRRSREAAQRESVEAIVRFEERDLFTVDLGEADVVTLYLPGSLLGRLVPQLKALRPGARIVSHEFVIPGVEPERTVHMISRDDGAEHVVHLWTAPLKFPKQ